MKVATILPVAYQYLEEANDYHMVLAHLVHDERYAAFFRSKAERGDHVLMDNGVVEVGHAMADEQIWHAASSIMATEIILPDVIGNREATSYSVYRAIRALEQQSAYSFDLMAVPQGRDMVEWGESLEEMLSWPIRSIGISKFVVVKGIYASRWLLLQQWLEAILDMGKEVHLLGSPLGPAEARGIEDTWPGKVRGIDSGYPTFCTAGEQGVSRYGRRPEGIEKDFDFLDGASLDHDLMESNYRRWRKWCGSPV